MTFAAFRDAGNTLTPHLLLHHEVRVAKHEGRQGSAQQSKVFSACSELLGSHRAAFKVMHYSTPPAQ